MPGKITFERGDMSSIWAGGRGYQPPAPTGGTVPEAPPDWGVAPHEEQAGSPDPPNLRPEPDPQPVLNNDDTIMLAVQAELARLEIPNELVNIDKGTARFRGHNLRLAPETQSDIQKLLAGEVVQKLKEEQERVIESVYDKRVPKPATDGWTDVPIMQRSKKSVGKKAKVRSSKVHRVRKPSANRKLAAVSVVPGYEDRQAGKGSAS